MPRDPDRSAPTSAGHSRVAAGGAALAVFAIAVCAYLNSLNGPPVLDDWQSVIENPSIRSLSHLGTVLTPDRGPTDGRPLLSLSLALNYAISGNAMWGYHLVSVLVHALAATTLFGVIFLSFGLPQFKSQWASARIPVAACISGLWSVHPLLTSVVAYASQRSESFVALFALVSLYGLLRAAETGRKRWLAISATASLCAAFFKEIAITIPLLVLLFDRAFLSNSYKNIWNKRRGYYLALALTSFAVVALLFAYPVHSRGIGLGLSVSPLAYLALEGGIVLRYLKLAIVPWPLVFDYGPLHPGVTLGGEALGAFGASVLAITALGLWFKAPAQGFLPLSVFIFLAPTSSFVPNLFQPAAESRMYLPLASLVCLAVVGIWSSIRYRGPGARAGFYGGVALIGTGLLALTLARNETYASEVTLWKDTVQREPNNPRAHNSLGTSLGLRSDIAGARAEFEAALKADPDYPPAQFNLGVSLLNAGDAAGALPHLQAATQAPEGKAEANLYLGQALLMLRRPSEAIAPFREAARLAPSNSEAVFELGNALGSLGRYSEATEALGRAAALRPDQPAVLNNFANALLFAGNVDQAIEVYRKALALAPENASIQADLDQALRLQASRRSTRRP